jgi:hypothetical protein
LVGGKKREGENGDELASRGAQMKRPKGKKRGEKKIASRVLNISADKSGTHDMELMDRRREHRGRQNRT